MQELCYELLPDAFNSIAACRSSAQKITCFLEIFSAPDVLLQRSKSAAVNIWSLRADRKCPVRLKAKPQSSSYRPSWVYLSSTRDCDTSIISVSRALTPSDRDSHRDNSHVDIQSILPTSRYVADMLSCLQDSRTSSYAYRWLAIADKVSRTSALQSCRHARKLGADTTRCISCHRNSCIPILGVAQSLDLRI